MSEICFSKLIFKGKKEFQKENANHEAAKHFLNNSGKLLLMLNKEINKSLDKFFLLVFLLHSNEYHCHQQHLKKPVLKLMSYYQPKSS